VTAERVLAFDSVAKLNIDVSAGFPTWELLSCGSTHPNSDDTLGLFNPLNYDQISVLLVNIRHTCRVSEPINDATITVPAIHL